MRLIPKNTKIKTQFYKGITLSDILLAVAALALCALAAASNLPYKFVLVIGILCLSIPLFLSIGEEKLYMSALYILRHLFSRKKFIKGAKDSSDISGLIPYEKIEDVYIQNKDGSFTGIIEIKPIEFRLMNEGKQDFLIDGVLTNVLSAVGTGQSLSIVKLDKPIVLDKQIDAERERILALIRNLEDESLTEDEYAARMEILEDRLTVIDDMNSGDSITYSCFYLVLYDHSLKSLLSTLSYMKQLLHSGSIDANVLDATGLKEFLTIEAEGIMPDEENAAADFMDTITPGKLEFRLMNTLRDNRQLSHFVVTQYPMKVYNAWGDELFDLSDTKVVMRLNVVDKTKAIKRIDTAINELSTQAKGKASAVIDKSTHVESLSALLVKLQNDNEALFDVTLIITVYDEPGKNVNKKAVKRKLREFGLSINEMAGRQADAYLTSGISTLDKVKISRGIQASSVAACFPFVSNAVVEDNGLLIGENKLPVIIDFFKRDDEYVNSNMIVVGKPGSGKSFAAKTLIANLASCDAKIYVLDPEAEYEKLTLSLKGKVIDAASAKYGKINPFHIITSLDDENEDGTHGSFFAHLQFLEEFFKQILTGINTDCLEMLNRNVLEVYNSKGITADTDFSALRPEDYPIFDDLAALIDSKLEAEQDQYTISCLKIIANYLSKFRSGGRNSTLWNGPSSFDAKENMVCFNFQKLLANKNNTTANAQMLLILKWLENEVIRNRDYNLKHRTNRKIVVVIDEAHLFIDEKFPVALDFMFQLAKRIRKYNGMQIVITQNIKDFAGTPETARKSMAIINVSQYSLIFALSPNDITDLCKLYEKAGQINPTESDNIIYNPRGCAFLISSPTSRTNIRIKATPYVESLFNTY